MEQNNKLIFVTHNKGKVESANKYFKGQLEFQTYDYEFVEIRSESLEEIAIAKVCEAYKVTKLPTIAIDAGFYVDELKGFPGAYVKHFLDTIGIQGLLKLMEGEENRTCCFRQCLAYYDGKEEPKVFYGEHQGMVSLEPKGVLTKHDWSELSYIFVPNGKDKVLGEMTDDERVVLSKENEENSAFKHFAEWYLDRMNSISEITENEGCEEELKMNGECKGKICAENARVDESSKENDYERNWEKTCDYIRKMEEIPDVSYQTWIAPLKLVECKNESLVFEGDYHVSKELLDNTFKLVKVRYEKIIVDAYNQCVGGEYKSVEMR